MTPISDADRMLVRDAVTAAERDTSGEIVTVVADRSDGYTDVALVWSIAVAFTAIACLTFFPAFFLGLVDHLVGGWNAHWTPAGLFGLALLVGIVKFTAMSLVQLWPPLKYLLIPGPIKAMRVHRRAVTLFKVGAEKRTQGATGVLLYVSLRERRAEIVADAPISQKVTPEVWGEAMVEMLADVRHGRVAQGMAAGVRNVGKVLSEHFPRADDDINEIPDRLIEI